MAKKIKNDSPRQHGHEGADSLLSLQPYVWPFPLAHYENTQGQIP